MLTWDTLPNHPHASQFLVCGDCGEVLEVEDACEAKNLQAAGTASGFRTKRLIVEVLGTCGHCSAKRHE
jgi:Fur family zinc uptake transcriptional regulator